ncbi:MAG: DUF3108 domain-containing protein [Candidatus Omnitrophota bacterium]
MCQLTVGIAVMAFCAAGCGIMRPYKISEQKRDDIRIEPPQPRLRIGEKFVYKAEWMGMEVGRATLLVKGITEMNGRQAYHVMAIAETTSLVSKLYKVEDVISTYIDTAEFYPLRFDKKQREGGHRSDGYLDFYQKEGKALYFSRLDNEKKEFKTPKRVQDPLSCIYYYRLSNVKAGETFSADVNLNDKNWFLEAKIMDKGVVRIPGVGEWKAFMAEPLPWFQGKLTRKAKVSIWFSADDDRIPLLVITSGIPFVGTVTITLQKIEYLENRNELIDKIWGAVKIPYYNLENGAMP